MAFTPFIYQKNFNYKEGWDLSALDYAQLLKPNTIYSLTKELAHEVLATYFQNTKQITILDLNCGTGNDFPYFLEKDYIIHGSDGSIGMLNKTHEIYKEHIDNGKIKLWYGMMENLTENSFDGQKFDLIYSITGGYSYINDSTFIEVNRNLSHHLTEGGLLITFHLTRFSLGELLFKIFTLKWRGAFLRLTKNLTISIHNKSYRMYLRNISQLKKLTPPELQLINVHPILSLTPPFQSGYKPSVVLLKMHKWIERRLLSTAFFCHFADQIALIQKKLPN